MHSFIKKNWAGDKNVLKQSYVIESLELVVLYVA